MTESQIIQGCRQGDRTAQHELYARTSDRIYRLLLRMTRNPEDAFDLTQDTYLRVFRNIDRFDATASITTWVYRIAVNEALQFLRRRKRGDRAIRQHGQAAQGASESRAADVRLDVEQAVAELPELERALVILRYFEGLSYAEMAAALARPPGTIASGLNRARSLLREYLEPESVNESRRKESS